MAGFAPANVAPGIGRSPDKTLQFNVLSYATGGSQVVSGSIG